MKKNMLLLGASCMMLGLCAPKATIHADSVNHLKSERQTIQNESKSLKGKIDSKRSVESQNKKEQSKLNTRVSSITSEVDQLTASINEQEQQINKKIEVIAELESEIQHLNRVIAGRKEKLVEQARALQIDGANMKYIEYLMSSENLSDLISRSQLVAQLVHSNRQALEQQKIDQANLQSKQDKQEQEKDELAQIKAKNEADQQTLIQNREKLNQEIEKLMNESAIAQSEREKLELKQRELNDKADLLSKQIAEEEAAQKAAEAARLQREKEAAAQAAQAAQNQASAYAAPVAQNQRPSSSGLIYPAQGVLTSPFGYRIHPITGASDFHLGIDLAGGGPIIAAQSGTVTAATFNPSYGNMIIIDHGNGLSTLYAHLQPGLFVSVGQSVAQGQQIGIMGTTGDSTGVHLHFEVRVNGSQVDPLGYL
ncbi:murein hydrolase activator EnvC family protein [Atopobacter phocae]|uniref:murein hydrolase activator EnvC family protein n=1 Tax=Atopobacter phocae TaxID=136492 RepID=UPI00047157DE|nr:peptidoglycan DD-metalloendopeptidase family protein [Atopobacter phocae]